MPAKREPKTIDEARAFLVGLLPVGWSLSIQVSYYDHRSAGRMSSSVSYDVYLYPSDKAGAGNCHATGHDPASLCRAALMAIRTFVDPRLLPAPAIAAAKPKRRLNGKTQLRLT